MTVPFDHTPRPGPVDDVDGLPAVLWTSPDGALQVVHGEDPGGFFCEHCLYAVRRCAAETDSIIVVDGEPLIGFLHVPKDAATDVNAPNPGLVGQPLVRHRATIDIVASVLRGWASLARVNGPLRVLLTGYGNWGTVANNPTGDLVEQQNVLNAIAGRVGVEVDIHTAHLAVDDSAIDGGPTSVQAAIARVRPQVVLSMGVHGGVDRYLAEHVASDRNLVVEGGVLRREADRPVGHRLPSNRALARGLVLGQRATS